jgi:hypothetical protein
MSLHPVARVGGPKTGAGVIHDDPELDDLRDAVVAHLRPALADLGHVGCRLDRHGSNVVVHLTGPEISPTRRQAVAVRIIDAVRSVGRTFGHVDVVYELSGGGPDEQQPDTGR